nr:immunoglobulin heavy chain junction region [Macaca mulatta]MOX59278.1 immunoglobulin heavy chain junction region [Macaca mulatta]MOX59637.1 immunoglobulin heavy chain junction region [Macaca mulatta]MOX60673.1 immunoglobulin heavy chain junction region [Macaca mulatta]MOX60917.1 immunoglobulin heavy chain junction region [Macaca mulatta]
CARTSGGWSPYFDYW